MNMRAQMLKHRKFHRCEREIATRECCLASPQLRRAIEFPQSLDRRIAIEDPIGSGGVLTRDHLSVLLEDFGGGEDEA